MSDRLKCLYVQLLRALLFGLLSYGLFYHSYKFHDPALIGVGDIIHYVPMYLSPLDFSVSSQPFVSRQLHAVVAHLIYAADISYDTLTAIGPQRQRVFFAALLSNYMGLMTCAVFTAAIAERLYASESPRRGLMLPLLSGCLCLLAFSVPVSVLTGVSEGWSWALVAAGFFAYLSNRTKATLAVLAVATLQREMVIIALAFIALPDMLMSSRAAATRAHARGVFLGSLVAASAYLLLRLSMGEASYAYQLDPLYYLSALAHPSRWLTVEVVFQGLLSQSTLFIYLLALIHRASGTQDWRATLRSLCTGRFGAAHMGAVLVAIYAIGIGAGIGNNVGRVAALLTPLWASLAAYHVAQADAHFASRPLVQPLTPGSGH